MILTAASSNVSDITGFGYFILFQGFFGFSVDLNCQILHHLEIYLVNVAAANGNYFIYCLDFIIIFDHCIVL